MPPNSDYELIRAYVERQDHAAFGRLSAQYLDLVYSAALRQVRRADWAEEITQVVFIILSRKADTLTPSVMLPAWLHRTARYTALNWAKVEARRRKHERRAAEMAETQTAPQAAWEGISPLLDQAVQALAVKDRDVILLRFFQQKSVAETGAALGISEDAAGMRISRAVEKLRRYFGSRGVILTSAIIGLSVMQNSVRAAPIGVPETVSHRLFEALAARPSAAELLDQASAMQRSLAMARLRFIGATILLVVILASFTTLAAHWLSVQLAPPVLK